MSTMNEDLTRGDRFLPVLQSLGVPGVRAWTGGDLDWMWEDEASKEMLDWVCAGLEGRQEEMVLTEDEIRRWEELQETEPGEILEGDILQEAIKTLEAESTESSLERRSDEELRDMLERMNEELDLRTASLDQMSHVSSEMSARQARQSVLLGSRMRMEEQARREVRGRQETAMQANERFNAAVERMAERVGEVVRAMEAFGVRKDECKMLSEVDFGELCEEEGKFSGAIEKMAVTQFDNADAGSDLDLLRERTEEEQLRVLHELERLRLAYKQCERQRPLILAKIAGSAAANEHADKCLQKYQQKAGSSEDITSLQLSAEDLEKKIHSLQSDIFSLINEKVTTLAENSAQFECKKIYVLNLQSQLHRLAWTRSRLSLLLDLVLEQRARQNVLEVLLDQERSGLDLLANKLFSSVGQNLHQSARDRLRSELDCLSKLKAFEEEKGREVIPTSDQVARTILAIVADRDLGSSLVTNFEAASLVKAFYEGMESEASAKETKGRELAAHQKVFETELPKLKKLLNIECGKQFLLSCPDIGARLHALQSGLRTFELTVKDSMSSWEKETRLLKQDPQLSTQKRIWVDFLTNPKLLEANVEAMKKRAAAAASK